jgi:hypothetical protein
LGFYRISLFTPLSGKRVESGAFLAYPKLFRIKSGNRITLKYRRIDKNGNNVL